MRTLVNSALKYFLLSSLISLLASIAWAISPTIADKLTSAYPGTCTPDGMYCAHFAPTEIPVHAIAHYLKSAKKSIRIATYNMDVEEFVDVLNDKLNQGVRVEFGADYKLSYQSNLVWNRLKPHKNLTKFRLPVFRGSNPQMHNKIIIIDGEVVVFGSANFTYSGLVANYENVLAVKQPGIVAKFSQEVDELKANALSSCRILASPAAACGTGTENWDLAVDALLKTGSLPANILSAEAKCGKLGEAWGLLDERNLLKFNLTKCITDAALRDKLLAAAKAIENQEKYVDGSPTSSATLTERTQMQSGPFEVYFSPEDNVQDALIRELKKTLANPTDAFALISTNFITNKRIADALVEMHRKGVRLQVFFDRGRFDDPSFQAQLQVLSEIGLTIFDNALTGPYGSNHNKMAVIGVGKDLTLLNGSANWSVSAMGRNDENFLIIRHPELAAIYAREIISQLYVYRFGHNGSDPAFIDFAKFISHRSPCLNALLIDGASCKASTGQEWRPGALSSAILSLEDVPADPKTEQVWVWVRQIEENRGLKALPLFTDTYFSGRWLTSVPVPPQWNIQFKFFKAPKGYDPNTQGIPNDGWEYQGSQGPDRELQVAPISAHVIRQIYKWGQK